MTHPSSLARVRYLLCTSGKHARGKYLCDERERKRERGVHTCAHTRVGGDEAVRAFIFFFLILLIPLRVSTLLLCVSRMAYVVGDW